MEYNCCVSFLFSIFLAAQTFAGPLFSHTNHCSSLLEIQTGGVFSTLFSLAPHTRICGDLGPRALVVRDTRPLLYGLLTFFVQCIL